MKKLVAALSIVLILLFSFIYITASGVSHLSNETILFLYLDETRKEPGTVEVASIAVFENAHLSRSLIALNPLESTPSLKNQGVFLSDCLIKSKSTEEGIKNALTIAEHQASTKIDRVVLVDAAALQSVIDAAHPIPIDVQFTVTALDKTFNLNAKTSVTGKAAEHCIRGISYPGITNDNLSKIPEDYLWEVKSHIINAVTTNLFDLSLYTPKEQKELAYIAVEHYRNDTILVYERTVVLTLVYYLPGPISKYIVGFAVRRIA